MPDIQINNHGSHPDLSAPHRDRDGVDARATPARCAGVTGIVVEPRYANDIVNGALEDGLSVE